MLPHRGGTSFCSAHVCVELRPGTASRNCSSTEAAAVPGRIDAGGPACEVPAAVSALCGFGAEQALAGCGRVPGCLRSIVAHGCPHNLGSRWLTPCFGRQGPASSFEVSIGCSARGTLTGNTGHSPRPISSDVPFPLSRWDRGAVGSGVALHPMLETVGRALPASQCASLYTDCHVKRFLVCVTISYSVTTQWDKYLIVFKL